MYIVLLINARAETLQTKPAFRNLLSSKRILIPSDGFYEWKREGKNKKQPYRFQMKTEKVYGFAGLFDEWEDPENGQTLRSCTIITTTPNELVSEVHDRMPVNLNRGAADVWLDPEVKDKERLQKLLKPLNSETMRSYPVSTSVGNVKNTGAELIEEIPLQISSSNLNCSFFGINRPEFWKYLTT